MRSGASLAHTTGCSLAARPSDAIARKELNVSLSLTRAHLSLPAERNTNEIRVCRLIARRSLHLSTRLRSLVHAKNQWLTWLTCAAAAVSYRIGSSTLSRALRQTVSQPVGRSLGSVKSNRERTASEHQVCLSCDQRATATTIESNNSQSSCQRGRWQLSARCSALTARAAQVAGEALQVTWQAVSGRASRL